MIIYHPVGLQKHLATCQWSDVDDTIGWTKKHLGIYWIWKWNQLKTKTWWFVCLQPVGVMSRVDGSATLLGNPKCAFRKTILLLPFTLACCFLHIFFIFLVKLEDEILQILVTGAEAPQWGSQFLQFIQISCNCGNFSKGLLCVNQTSNGLCS